MTPDFLVTIDTEADNEWERGTEATYHNLSCLECFEEVCERHGVRPTYLVTYDVVRDTTSLRVLKRLLAGGNCEIGAHLHSWSTPPENELSPGFFHQRPYLHEYPPEVQAMKLDHLTGALADSFSMRPTSYRGGRWSFDATALSLLLNSGYLVDSTVTPGVDWGANPGFSANSRGPDFAGAPRRPYFPAIDDVTRPGNSRLLEVPVSVAFTGPLRGREPGSGARTGVASSPLAALIRSALDKTRLCHRVWLRPGYSSLREMKQVCDQACRQEWPVLNLMFHSSELLPGGSPRVPTQEAADRFLSSLARLFSYVTEELGCRCRTLSEFAGGWLRQEVRGESRSWPG